MVYEDEFQKVQEALPNAEQDIPQLRRYLKGKGMSDAELNGVDTADEVLTYFNQMKEEQQQRAERLQAGAAKARKRRQQKNQLQADVNNKKLSPQKRIEALLLMGGK